MSTRTLMYAYTVSIEFYEYSVVLVYRKYSLYLLLVLTVYSYLLNVHPNCGGVFLVQAPQLLVIRNVTDLARSFHSLERKTKG